MERLGCVSTAQGGVLTVPAVCLSSPWKDPPDQSNSSRRHGYMMCYMENWQQMLKAQVPVALL
jgi:hypothetical protein